MMRVLMSQKHCAGGAAPEQRPTVHQRHSGSLTLQALLSLAKAPALRNSKRDNVSATWKPPLTAPQYSRLQTLQCAGSSTQEY
jgi:hypothetical protein